jgi:hypothetical protein
MRSNGRKISRPRHWVAVTLAMGLLAAAPWAQAASFETYYGEKDKLDGGEDVKSVQYCEGSGSIVAGTRRLPDGNSEVLVTRAADDGTVLTGTQWGYRIADAKQSSAFGIVELRERGGFVLTGAVNVGEGSQIYAMRIDCDGKPAWTTLLGNRKETDLATGYDVLQSSKGDLVVVGEELGRDGELGVGRIARLSTSGALIFDQTYDGPEAKVGLRFRAVAETLDKQGSETDLVVAGSAVNDNAVRGALMFRTDSGGAPLCDAVLGDGNDNREFLGVTALKTATRYGETVLVGALAGLDQGAPSSAYLARFARGGCTVQAQSVISDNGNVYAFDVAETPELGAGGTALVVTGTVNTPATGTRGYLFVANAGDLLQNSAPPRLFGTLLRRAETLYAIDRKDDAYVLAGSTFSDPEGVGDRQDFYLVQTDSGMKTGCTEAWAPRVVRVAPKPRSFVPRVDRAPEPKESGTAFGPGFDVGVACDPTKDCEAVIDNGTVKLGVDKTGFLNVDCPDPLRAPLSVGRYGTHRVGLRYMIKESVYESDAAAPGCPCEGWGVADASSGLTAHTSMWEGTSGNMIPSPLVYTNSTAKSVVDILDGSGNPALRVTHNYVPTSITPYLYRVEVQIENIGKAPIRDLRYTRGIDYDVAPNAFSEYITIVGAGSPLVVAANDNGFNSVDPLAIDSNLGMTGNFTDWGAGDRGAHFDFRLGSLNPGQIRNFLTYYGAAPTEVTAINALNSVGANIYSLGQSNWSGSAAPPIPWASGAPFGSYGYKIGGPATFMYGVDKNQSEP